MTATGVITWSQTASSNGSADGSVNFAEGMAPSAVNDSARALMASVAKWRDDLAGAIVTTGTSTAYAVTSYQVEASLTAGYVIAFAPHTTNGATVTLNVDGLGAKPLRSAPDTELKAGVLVEGTPYVATYFSSNSGEWILHGFYAEPHAVPIGGLIPYVGSTAPTSNYVLPYGQAISRATYASLFSLCSTTFGSGDGSTTFNVPDLRGRAIFGLDNMGGTAASRVTDASGIGALTVGATGGTETHTLTTSEMPSHKHTVTDPGHSHGGNSLYVGQESSNTNASAGSTSRATSFTNSWSTASATTGISLSNTGGGGAHNNMPPCIILPMLLRVL